MLLPVPANRVLLAPAAKSTLMIVLHPAVEMVSSFLMSSCNLILNLIREPFTSEIFWLGQSKANNYEIKS